MGDEVTVPYCIPSMLICFQCMYQKRFLELSLVRWDFLAKRSQFNPSILEELQEVRTKKADKEKEEEVVEEGEKKEEERLVRWWLRHTIVLH